MRIRTIAGVFEISTTKQCLVTIPAFGSDSLTHGVLPDVVAEHDLVDLLIIDNGGSYQKVGDEWVIRPGSNIGWAAASNMGFRIAFARGYRYGLTLNNDTRLSPGFFAGLLDPRLPDDAGIIGPTYDDSWWPTQASDFEGAASEYQPTDCFREVPMVDGTAMLLSAGAWERVGGLDERSFGRFAWGADIDLAFRVSEAGFGVYVTERSFLNHRSKSSASAVFGKHRYVIRANRDCTKAMKRIHGRNTFRALKKSTPVRRRLPDANGN